MSSLFTETFFRKKGNFINEAYEKTFSEKSTDIETKFDIFLSYNFKDRTVVLGVYKWLKDKGYQVYLDFIVDSKLDRSNVNRETAEIIHKRLLNSKALLYAHSPNASLSKWMPWELGVVDGNTRKCAIMPISTDGRDVNTRQEYLLLYPVVKLNSSTEVRVYTDKSPLYGKNFKDFFVK